MLRLLTEQTRTQPTGRAIIQVAETGENAILLHAGTNALVNESHLPSALGRGDVCLLQNEIANGPALARAAHVAGALVVLNPAPCTQRVLDEFDRLAHVHVLIVNEHEAAMLCPRAAADDLLALQHQLFACSSTLQLVLVTLGARGAAALWRDQPTPAMVDALRVHSVDTTGAGDTFIGYFVATLVRNGVHAVADQVDAVLHAVRWGTVAAGMACERSGAMASIPTRSEVAAHAVVAGVALH